MTDLLGSYGLIPVVSAAIFGPLAGWFAERRDRHPVVWLFFGALLGPIAVGILAAAPPGRCPLCDTPVQGWRTLCAVCGGPLSVGSRSGSVLRRATADFDSAVQSTTRPIPVATQGVPPPAITPTLGAAAIVRARGRREVPVDLPPGALGGGPSAASDHAVDVGEVLATGVYFGGTARLVVGSRYVIVRHQTMLRLLGPVDRDPSEIALERPLANLTATAIGERLVITEYIGGRVGLALAIGVFAGASGAQLEVALSSADERPSDRRPASG